MAYTRDDAGPVESRPLMFSFNGGPGSASVWLHLGTLGPRRVAHARRAHDPGAAVPAGRQRRDLARPHRPRLHRPGRHRLLAARPSPSSTAKFHSLRGDIESVGEFIRMYLTRYDRWSSPLYLIGESYGTTRAAGLAGHLVDQGIAFNGVILVSSVLDFQGIVFSAGQRPAVPDLSPLVHGHRLVSQEAAGRPAAARPAGGAQGGRRLGRPRVRHDPAAGRPALRRRAAAGRRSGWRATPG